MSDIFLWTFASIAGIGAGWYLSREWAHASAQTAQSRWTYQRGVLVIMAGVGAGFWVMLALGFRIHDQVAPAGLDDGLLPAVAVLIATITIGVRHLWTHRDSVSSALTHSSLPKGSSQAMAEFETWLNEISADPLRRRYVTMIAAGDLFWTRERVEYDVDPAATTCCVHLAPIEAAMRSGGVRVRLASVGTANAECRIDAHALEHRFQLVPSVGYREMHIYDRSIHDPPQALVECALCVSRIWVKHPSEAAADMPFFPTS